jgi:hypothetical protein
MIFSLWRFPTHSHSLLFPLSELNEFKPFSQNVFLTIIRNLFFVSLSESTAYYCTSRVLDDGILDPRHTRDVLGICLSVRFDTLFVVSFVGDESLCLTIIYIRQFTLKRLSHQVVTEFIVCKTRKELFFGSNFENWPNSFNTTTIKHSFIVIMNPTIRNILLLMCVSELFMILSFKMCFFSF